MRCSAWIIGRWITSLSMIVVIAVGWGTGTAGGAPARAGTIDLGYLNALTGPYAVAGAPEFNGAKLGITNVNATGGVCGRKLRIADSVDDQGQANLSVVGLRKLTEQDGLKLIIGPGITPPSLADAPVAEALKTLLFVQTAQAATWLGRHYVFSDITPQPVFARLMVGYMKRRLGPGAHRIAILYANVPFGQIGFDLLKPLVRTEHWKLVATDNWDPGSFDFTPQAQKIARVKPDGLFLWGAATPADGQVLKQVRQAGYTGPAVGEAAYSLPDVPKVAGKAATTVIAFSQLNVIHPNAKTRTFLKAYQSAFHELPTFLPGGAYDIVHIIAKAIARARCNTDPTAVAHAMIGLNYKGVNGTYHYRSTYKAGPGAGSFQAITFNSKGQQIAAPK